MICLLTVECCPPKSLTHTMQIRLIIKIECEYLWGDVFNLLCVCDFYVTGSVAAKGRGQEI